MFMCFMSMSHTDPNDSSGFLQQMFIQSQSIRVFIGFAWVIGDIRLMIQCPLLTSLFIWHFWRDTAFKFTPWIKCTVSNKLNIWNYWLLFFFLGFFTICKWGLQYYINTFKNVPLKANTKALLNALDCINNTIFTSCYNINISVFYINTCTKRTNFPAVMLVFHVSALCDWVTFGGTTKQQAPGTCCECYKIAHKAS